MVKTDVLFVHFNCAHWSENSGRLTARRQCMGSTSLVHRPWLSTKIKHNCTCSFSQSLQSLLCTMCSQENLTSLHEYPSHTLWPKLTPNTLSCPSQTRVIRVDKGRQSEDLRLEVPYISWTSHFRSAALYAWSCSCTRASCSRLSTSLSLWTVASSDFPSSSSL